MGGGGSKIFFDEKTGALTLIDGNSSETIAPDDKIDLENYIGAIQKAQANGLKSVRSSGSMNMGSFQESSRMESVVKGEELPSVRAIQIKNPPIRAVVYIDAKGTSKFLYKNDPQGLIKLIPGGFEAGGGGKDQGSMNVGGKDQGSMNVGGKDQGSMNVGGKDQGSMNVGPTVATKDAWCPNGCINPNHPEFIQMRKGMQCIGEILTPILTATQKEAAEMGMKKCMAAQAQQAQQAPPNPPTVPAPPGVSTYAFEGAINQFTAGTGYPNWVILVAIFAVMTALAVAKKM
jgi:hypothetical protein